MHREEPILGRSLIFECPEQIRHGQHTDDGAVCSDGQMPDALFLHEHHRFRQRLVFFNRDNGAAHAGGNGRRVDIKAFRHGFPAQI